MYHCVMEEDDDDPSGFEKPCSCAGPGAAARWACLGAASLALPCLCCYLVLKGAQRCVEAVHRRATAVGCKCEGKRAPAGVSVITTGPVPAAQVRAQLSPQNIVHFSELRSKYSQAVWVVFDGLLPDMQ